MSANIIEKLSSDEKGNVIMSANIIEKLSSKTCACFQCSICEKDVHVPKGVESIPLNLGQRIFLICAPCAESTSVSDLRAKAFPRKS